MILKQFHLKLIQWSFTSGKFYYDLIAKRVEINSSEDTGVYKIRTIIPIPRLPIEIIIKKYKNAVTIYLGSGRT